MHRTYLPEGTSSPEMLPSMPGHWSLGVAAHTHTQLTDTLFWGGRAEELRAKCDLHSVQQSLSICPNLKCRPTENCLSPAERAFASNLSLRTVSCSVIC